MESLSKDASKDDTAKSAPVKRTSYLCNIKIDLLEDLETYVRCSVVCEDANELRKHRATHKGEKRFECRACEYKTANGGHLKEHFRAKHTLEKPFTCPECSYTSSRISHLRQHMLRHSGIKPYACDHCTAKFARRGHLDVHLRTHTGEKPFHCDQCGYRCTEKSRLRRHVLSVHLNPRFSCDHCEFKCSQVGMLNVHLVKEHGYCSRCRREEQGLTANKNWGAHTCSKRRQNTGFVLTEKANLTSNVSSADSQGKSRRGDQGSTPLLQQNILRFEMNKRKLVMQEKYLKQLQKEQDHKERQLQEKERQLREREVRLLRMAQQMDNAQNNRGRGNATSLVQKHKTNKKRKRVAI